MLCKGPGADAFQEARAFISTNPRNHPEAACHIGAFVLVDRGGQHVAEQS
jgi:hypothetical protein